MFRRVSHGNTVLTALDTAMVDTLRQTGWGYAEATSDRRDSVTRPPAVLLGDPSGVHPPWKVCLRRF